VPAVLQRHILSRRFVVLAQRRWPQNISCPFTNDKDRRTNTGAGLSLWDTRSGDRAIGGAASNGTPQRSESAHGRFAQWGQCPPVGGEGA
jgi:hypothetical protein